MHHIRTTLLCCFSTRWGGRGDHLHQFHSVLRSIGLMFQTFSSFYDNFFVLVIFMSLDIFPITLVSFTFSTLFAIFYNPVMWNFLLISEFSQHPSQSPSFRKASLMPTVSSITFLLSFSLFLFYFFPRVTLIELGEKCKEINCPFDMS